MAAPQKTLTLEPCTLVYTLVNPNIISFDDFCLIIRSLHSYMVQAITPNASMNNIHVKLGYQASIANAQAKLGMLKTAVLVTKLGSYIDVSELSRLESLRQTYGIGGCSTQSYTPTTSYSYIPAGLPQPSHLVQSIQSGQPAVALPKFEKPRGRPAKRGGGKQRTKCFPVRSAPYARSEAAPEVVDIVDYEDSQAFPAEGQEVPETYESDIHAESTDEI